MFLHGVNGSHLETVNATNIGWTLMYIDSQKCGTTVVSVIYSKHVMIPLNAVLI